MTRRLILVRHSLSAALPDAPQEAWMLTPEGEARCLGLATELRPFALDRVITSTETKAQRTGELLAQALGIPWQTAPDLQETARGNRDFFADRAAFVECVRRAMQHPDDVVFGSERFNAASERFLRRTDHLLHQYPDETLAFVSHGRVLSMVLGDLLARDSFSIWQELAMPAYAVFTLPDWLLERFVPTLSEA